MESSGEAVFALPTGAILEIAPGGSGWLSTFESVSTIVASIAICITAFVAIRQLRQILDEAKRNESQFRSETLAIIRQYFLDREALDQRFECHKLAQMYDIKVIAEGNTEESVILMREVFKLEALAHYLNLGLVDENLIRSSYEDIILADYHELQEFISSKKSKFRCADWSSI